MVCGSCSAHCEASGSKIGSSLKKKRKKKEKEKSECGFSHTKHTQGLIIILPLRSSSSDSSRGCNSSRIRCGRGGEKKKKV